MKGKRLVIVLCVLTAVGRIFIVPIIKLSWTDAYIASAHLFAGFLIGVRFYDWQGKMGPTRLYWWLGWGLAFYELAWYLTQKRLLGG